MLNSNLSNSLCKVLQFKLPETITISPRDKGDILVDADISGYTYVVGTCPDNTLVGACFLWSSSAMCCAVDTFVYNGKLTIRLVNLSATDTQNISQIRILAFFDV